MSQREEGIRPIWVMVANLNLTGEERCEGRCWEKKQKQQVSKDFKMTVTKSRCQQITTTNDPQRACKQSVTTHGLQTTDIPLLGCLAYDTENLLTAGIESNSEEIKEASQVIQQR